MAQCNVNTLLANAACFECVSPGMWEILELQLLCEILNSPLIGGKQFVSGLFDIATVDNQITIPHGLGAVPKSVYVVTVAVGFDGDLRYPIGTELDLFSWTSLTANGWAVSADATNIYVICANFPNSGQFVFQTMTFNSQDIQSYDNLNNWKIKAYARI